MTAVTGTAVVKPDVALDARAGDGDFLGLFLRLRLRLRKRNTGVSAGQSDVTAPQMRLRRGRVAFSMAPPEALWYWQH